MRHLVAVLAALVLSVSAAPASAAPSAPARVEPDFTGTVSMRGCSGAVVRPPAHQPSDPALVMTNGHCVRFLEAEEVVVDQPADREFTLLDSTGEDSLGDLRAATLVYATMSRTDVALYRLTATYGDIEAMGGRALELSAEHPAAGIAVGVVSGYWRHVYSCDVDGYAYRLREGRYTWHDSMRYTADCRTRGGTSGSPVVDVATGKVVAVNNTGNEDGERCTDNNPCEVDAAGEVTVRQGIGYAQQTFQIVPCLTGGGRVDLAAPGCGLPRPAA
ncbi:S1 family peptidase [Saccharothrix texasensis]|uniref:Trypsin-like peptidase n=1 Tax=Saccharothrix texasensis TaxID=103734 RepID=A0A3N1HEY6_9PSEU|nr:serine protease [Saccharothrix texasensis]ROP41060.1 trypsin-like peptidase [Saccharothrix texasensis]